MIPPSLTLSNIRYISRVKWSNPGKGVAPSPTPRCSSYWKGSLLVTLNYSCQLYYLSLWTESDPDEWRSIFIVAVKSIDSAKLHTWMLDCSVHKELSIRTLVEILAILNLVKEPPASPPSQANYAKMLISKLPQIHLDNMIILKVQNSLGYIHKNF